MRVRVDSRTPLDFFGAQGGGGDNRGRRRGEGGAKEGQGGAKEGLAR